LLPGCEADSYSDALAFPLRTDPIILSELPQEERVEPDRPGQLPLLSISQLPRIATLFPEGKTEQAKLLDPTKISAADREKFESTLNEIFGKPAEPRLNLKGIEEARKALRLDDKSLAKGSRYYRIHCMHCHGLTGDGRGPTAAWVNPHPRDYRPGLFKFQSVDQKSDKAADRKPLREDLLRTLTNGVEGTAMPAFNMLSLGDREALVSYVIYLSLRGEAELATFKEAFEEKGGQVVLKAGLKIPKIIRDTLLGNKAEEVVGLIAKWEESLEKKIKAVDYPAKYTNGKLIDKALKDSILRGQALFLADNKKLKDAFPDASKETLELLAGSPCSKCHVDYGRQALYKFDAWGTMVRPANLTTGVYRGGRRPIDLYWRIHSGINGSNMTFTPGLDGDQLWDLVNFLQALPYPNMLQKAGINDIY
jgi:mono/diheme cytochrome c family protein